MPNLHWLVVHTFFTFLICLSRIAFGQHHTFKNFNDRNGLPSSEVYQVFQDKHNFIWFATTNGAVRYDGSKFEVFDKSNGLPDPVVFGFYEDKMHRIWFRSFSGRLSYFKNDSIIEYQHNEQIKKFLNNSIVSDLAVDSLGQLWLASSVQGCISMIQTNGKLYNYNQEKSSAFLKQVNSKDFIMGYAGFSKHIKSLAIGEKKFSLTLSDTSEFNTVTSHTLWKGYLFFSINKNIFRFDGTSVRCVLKSKQPIINISTDRYNLWVGFLNDGVKRFTDINLKESREFIDLKNKSVTTVLQDNEGGYWFSTLDRGVYYFPDLSIDNYTFDQDSKVFARTFVDKTIFTGNYKGQVIALDRISGKRKIICDLKSPILTLFRDKSNSIWVSSARETIVIGWNRKIRKHIPHVLNVKSFSQGNNGTIWAANHLGIYKFDKNYNIILEKATDERLTSIFVTENAVYTASLIGLQKYDTLLKHKDLIQEFANEKVSGISEFGKNRLLITTIGSGFYILNGNYIRAYKKGKGFFANNIYCSVVNAEFVWMSTENGLVRTEFNELNGDTLECRFITRSSGQLGHMHNSLMIEKDTLFTFSETDFSALPLNISPSWNNYSIASIHCEVNDVSHDIVPFEKFKYYQNNLKVVVRVVAYNNQDVQLRYKLNVLGWETGLNRELNFFALAPGDYQLQIQFSADGHTWKSLSNLNFIISAPWWETWYFILTVFLVLGTFIAVIFYLRLRAFKEKKTKEIEHQRSLMIEKGRISKDLHDNIGSRLTLINLDLNQLAREFAVPDERLAEINYRINSTTIELRNTIWVINKEEITLEEFVQKVRNLLWRFQQRNGLMNCDVNFLTGHKDRVLRSAQAINLFRIIQEAISNSLKHSGADQLTLTVDDDSDQSVKIVIEDNGSGFESKQNINGEHYGLENMKKRAKEINASLNITSRSNLGTIVTVYLPLSN